MSHKPEHSSLSRLYKIGNLALFAALLLIVASSLSSLHTSIYLSNAIVERSLSEIHEAMSLRLSLNRFAMSLDDYIVRPDAEEKESVGMLRDQVDEGFGKLSAALPEKPELRADLDEANKEWKKVDTLTLGITKITNPARTPRAIVDMQLADELINHTTDLLDSLYNEIYIDTLKNRDQLDTIEQRATILVTLLSAIGIIIAIAGSLQLARLFFPPLNTMLAGIRIFGRGHLDYRIEDKMPMEFEELADGINTMAAKLEDIYSELSESSNRDHLTGCYNRRKMEDDLMRAFSQSKRADESLSVLMIDLDHFKRTNDSYGHAAGDSVLKSVADTMRGQLRKHETLYRIGGEEFVILLPTTGAEEAAVVAERVRLHTEQKSIDVGGDHPISISISIGIAASPQHAASTKELIEMSDKALYQAKKEGRNRVVVLS